MAESQVMFGLKMVAKHLNISVPKVKEFFKKGMPHTKDESGMYITTKKRIDEWFDKEIEKEKKKK